MSVCGNRNLSLHGKAVIKYNSIVPKMNYDSIYSLPYVINKLKQQFYGVKYIKLEKCCDYNN